jgi:hypothetical protein
MAEIGKPEREYTVVPVRREVVAPEPAVAPPAVVPSEPAKTPEPAEVGRQVAIVRDTNEKHAALLRALAGA